MKHHRNDTNHVETWKVFFKFDYLNTDLKTVRVRGRDMFEAIDALKKIFQPSWLSEYLSHIELELPF